MGKFEIIREIVIILLFSIPIIALFRKINLSAIIGFLFTGIIIGPFGLRLIETTEEIEVIAELGVILLMFSIGLEFSVKQLLKMWKELLINGGLQVTLTIVFTGALMYLLGLPLKEAAFIGILASLSSTAVVMKLLADSNSLNSSHGKASVGILIFQDVAIVPLMIIVQLLGETSKQTVGDVLLKTGVSIGTIIAILFFAQKIVPLLLHWLVRVRVREAFTAGTILLILGTAYVTELSGLTFSIGAFIAGLIISESEYSHQIVSEIIPLKDLFNSIFFVSIGLLLNIYFLMENVVLVSTALLGLIFIKSFLIFLILKARRATNQTALVTGLTLCQVGEFSFVIAQLGGSIGLMSPEINNTFLAVSIFSLFLTPVFVNLSAPFARRVETLTTSNNNDGTPELKDHVIIAGFGHNGRTLARVLKESGIRYRIIEYNPDLVQYHKSRGEDIMYGDITRRDILEVAGAQYARVMVFAISDAKSTRIGLHLVRELNDDIYTIIRTRYVRDVADFREIGASEVIPDELETSLMIFSRVLKMYHFPSNIIMRQLSVLRSHSYDYLRSSPDNVAVLDHIQKVLAEGLSETIYIEKDNPNIGRELKSLDIRAKTGAIVLSIIRSGQIISSPSGEEKLLEDDQWLITGTHAQVDSAMHLLTGNDEGWEKK